MSGERNGSVSDVIAASSSQLRHRPQKHVIVLFVIGLAHGFMMSETKLEAVSVFNARCRSLLQLIRSIVLHKSVRRDMQHRKNSVHVVSITDHPTFYPDPPIPKSSFLCCMTLPTCWHPVQQKRGEVIRVPEVGGTRQLRC